MVKEFKFKETPLLQDLRLTKSGAKCLVEPIDAGRPISAYHDAVANEKSSLADLTLSGRPYRMSKAQIKALEVVYVATLAQVYKASRSLYMKLLRQMKPSAYLEIQGMHNFANATPTLVSPREMDQPPPELQLQDLYAIVVGEAA